MLSPQQILNRIFDAVSNCISVRLTNDSVTVDGSLDVVSVPPDDSGGDWIWLNIDGAGLNEQSATSQISTLANASAAMNEAVVWFGLRARKVYISNPGPTNLVVELWRGGEYDPDTGIVTGGESVGKNTLFDGFAYDIPSDGIKLTSTAELTQIEIVVQEA